MASPPISTGTPGGRAGAEPAAGGRQAELEAGALGVMRAMRTAFDAVVKSVPAEVLERRPAPGEWSPREVLGHLLYVEDLLRARVESMIADDDDVPMPRGAAAPPPGAPLDSLVAWRAARAETLAWLSTLGPAELERAGVSARFGRITAREQVAEWAYHDLDHIRQLLAAIESNLYPSISGYQRLYPPPFPGMVLPAKQDEVPAAENG